jgi:hypothetical protein
MKALCTLNSVCLLAAAGLALCLVLERQARFKLDRENKALWQQLSRMPETPAGTQNLSHLVVPTNALPSQPSGPEQGRTALDDPAKELLRLRGEVVALRQRNAEIESLRADTRKVLAERESGRVADSGNPTPGDGLEIVTADYWTANTNLDVAQELRDRIRNGSLKAIASNNLKGDPDFGQAKSLTVVYRFGGVTLTNQFREGEFVVLPKE